MSPLTVINHQKSQASRPILAARLCHAHKTFHLLSRMQACLTRPDGQGTGIARPNAGRLPIQLMMRPSRLFKLTTFTARSARSYWQIRFGRFYSSTLDDHGLNSLASGHGQQSIAYATELTPTWSHIL